MHQALITVDSPLGPLTIRERAGAIVALDWGAAPAENPTPLLAVARQQLDAYFHRRLQQFDLPLAPSGSAFDQAVWTAMQKVPYGTTCRYADLAKAVNGIARAVGVACGRNPLPIFIPCHRVVAAGDRLGGYSGGQGPRTKHILLELEGALLPLGLA